MDDLLAMVFTDLFAGLVWYAAVRGGPYSFEYRGSNQSDCQAVQRLLSTSALQTSCIRWPEKVTTCSVCSLMQPVTMHWIQFRNICNLDMK